MKRFLTLLIACSMTMLLIPNLLPKVVATSMDMDEILYNYHQEAFRALQTGENINLSARSLTNRSETKTLEEETVDLLNNAGYEAYNITNTNYAQFEDFLQTDLSSLGIDPNGSYIVVLNDEYSEYQSNAQHRILDPITPVPGSPAGGGSGFYYTYNETTYLMRTITVTSASASLLTQNSTYTIEKVQTSTDYIGDILDALFSVGIDAACDGLPVSTVLSLLTDWSSNNLYTNLHPGDLTLHAMTSWTRKYIQVKDNDLSIWFTAQGSSYAVSCARVAGYVYNSQTNAPKWIDSGETSTEFYSDFYSESTVRYTRAVYGFIEKVTYMDYTGNITFHFHDKNGVSINSDGKPLFKHVEPVSKIIPDYEDT